MISIDFETRSFADLAQVGSWVYSEHHSTDVIVLCYAIDNQPIRYWLPKHLRHLIPDYPKNRTIASAGDMPADLYVVILEGHHVEAHNVAFEYGIWANIMVARYGWIKILNHQWRDSMAAACYYALPAKLDKLARALGFQGKDPEGERLISKYCKLYLKTAKQEIPVDDLRKFIAYCRKDVEVEQAVSDYLGDLPDREQKCYTADLIMNARGLFLDAEGIANASAIVDQRAEELTKEFNKLTGLNPTQGAKLLVWFAGQGWQLENLQAGYLQDLLDDGEMPQCDARRALEIRLKINKASTKKLDAMARQRGQDGRARFQGRYHGAMSGRPTGAGFQPLNLNRGYDSDTGISPDQLVRDISYRNGRYLDAIYGDATDAVAKASRHWIMAEPGNKIMSGDYVSIEAVILACLAGEEWKIEAFRNKVKLYELMGDKIHGLPPGTVTKATHPAERQDGKTGELAFGYQGALGAWLKFDDSGRHSDERILEINKAWRAEHPATQKMWYGLEAAAIEAVTKGHGYVTGYRQIGFEMVDEWLSMILPDGKRLWYRDAQLRVGMPPWHQPKIKEDCASGDCSCRPREYISYLAMKAGQWIRVSTYGGKLTENAAQGTSRQILEPAKQRVAKYMPGGLSSIILAVYDEIVTEIPENFGSEERFREILEEPAGDWCKGWPIRAETWVGSRYRK